MKRNLFKDREDASFDELNKLMYGKYSAYYHNWAYYGWSYLHEDMTESSVQSGEFQQLVEFKHLEVAGEVTDFCNVLLFGNKGTVQYKIQHAPHVEADADSYIVLKAGHHSPAPIYEGQAPTKESCKYLEGLPCYFNHCSRLIIDGVTSMYQEEGIEEFWQCMEGWYYYFFEPDHYEKLLGSY